MKRGSINPYLANMRRPGVRIQAATVKPRLLAMLTFSTILGCFWTLEAQSGPAPAFYVSVERGRLSVNAESIVLRRLLEEIATQVNGQLLVSESAVNSEISADLQNLPLEVGIRRLLRGISYVLEDSSPLNVWTLRILPSGPTQTEPKRDAVWDRPKTLGQKTTESNEAAQTNAHIFEPPAVVTDVEIKKSPPLETLEQLLLSVQDSVTPAERDAAMNAFSDHEQGDITKLLATT